MISDRMIRTRILELTLRHGSLRAAARAIDIDPAYLLRLRRGEKTAPSPIVLRKLGLRRVTKYERYP